MASILVIEDDEWSRRIVVELLQRHGHAVTEAADVPAARAALASSYDLVLLDIHLPGGSGEQILREIRAVPRWSSLPVIAVTASAMTGDRERLLREGFTAYLSKPIDVRTFPATIDRYLRGDA